VLNGLDLVVLVLLAASAVAGFRRGALLQILAYGGLVAGLVAGALLGPPLASLARSHLAQAGIAVALLLGGAGIGNALGWLAGTWVRTHAHRTRFRSVDAAGGSLVSVVATLLAVWFIALNLVNGPFALVAREIRGSVIVRDLGTALPEPPSVLGDVRKFFNRFGFPEVFSGLPPAPAGPVKLPTQAEARQASRAAEASTVRVVGRACGEIQSGSGFVVADHYILTNAHVVAGVGALQVQEQNGDSQTATPVLYDPRTDLAVLYVSLTPGPPLPLDPQLVARGAAGATLGYPGGGGLTIDRAAVRRPIDAVGRDIYGRHSVEREVYELQADIVPGDSGGPFVLADGSVAGVVFAASTTEQGVGYAIASTDVIPDVQQAVGTTVPASTGACVR